MCTLVILHRPGHDWPLIIAANRDEMRDRPWSPPARHWPDRPHIMAGRDDLAGGTWAGINDYGLMAGVLNRTGSLGTDPEHRSRGELPLEALDHAEAGVAAAALTDLDPDAYRPFNLFVGDWLEAHWIASDGKDIRAQAVPEGLSMLTDKDLNDTESPRVRRFLPLFKTASVPDPETGDWSGWQALMAARLGMDESRDAMNIETETGFGTVSSSLIAIPKAGNPDIRPVWLFTTGAPHIAPYKSITGL